MQYCKPQTLEYHDRKEIQVQNKKNDKERLFMIEEILN